MVVIFKPAAKQTEGQNDGKHDQEHIFGLAGAATTLVGYPAPDVKAADLKGGTISWMIPIPEGGGSGRWARFAAPFLEKQQGATIRVKIVPGGGSTKATNLYASRAKANDLELLGTSGSTQFPFEFKKHSFCAMLTAQVIIGPSVEASSGRPAKLPNGEQRKKAITDR